MNPVARVYLPEMARLSRASLSLPVFSISRKLCILYCVRDAYHLVPRRAVKRI